MYRTLLVDSIVNSILSSVLYVPALLAIKDNGRLYRIGVNTARIDRSLVNVMPELKSFQPPAVYLYWYLVKSYPGLTSAYNSKSFIPENPDGWSRVRVFP